MGCAPSKNAPLSITLPRTRVTPIKTAPIQNKMGAKVDILDSIKRADIILFEKTLNASQIRANEIIGPADQQKTILHHIAESNFPEGMSLALEYLLQNEEKLAGKIINAQDNNGNTPAIACVISEAPECLEILAKSGFVDASIKNSSGQNVLHVANDNDSVCANAISMLNITKDTAASMNPSTYSSNAPTPSSHRFTFLPSNLEFPASPGTKGSIQLKSLQGLKKESKLGSDTKLYQLMGELNNEDFIDEEFPHDNEGVAHDEAFQPYNEFGAIKWLRPNAITELKGLSPILFEGIDLNNVKQSPLIGCDLYSALATMTEFPQRLLKIFTSKDTSKQGAYSVKFLVSGIPLEILIDDYIPCLKDNQPLFSKPNSSEIWFLLLEKAFAKLYGSYDHIKQVGITEALEVMTGMPTSQTPLKNADSDIIWNHLNDSDKKNFILCAGNNQKAHEKHNRIFPIVRVYEQDEHRILKLRNPFDDFKWRGNYSDGSSHWTKDLKEAVGYYTGEKNCFYMDLNEFMNQFEFVTVSHYLDGWVRKGKEATTSAKKAAFFEVELEREMEVILSVHQKLPGFVEEEGYQVSPVEILVGEELADEMTIRKVGKIYLNLFFVNYYL